MIFCTVNGGSQEERQLIEEAFYFAVEELMPRKQKLDGFPILEILGQIDFTTMKIRETK